MNYQFIAFTFGDTMTYRGKADCGLPTVRFRFRNQVDVVVPFDEASVINTESRGEDLKSSIPWLLVYWYSTSSMTFMVEPGKKSTVYQRCIIFVVHISIILYRERKIMRRTCTITCTYIIHVYELMWKASPEKWLEHDIPSTSTCLPSALLKWLSTLQLCRAFLSTLSTFIMFNDIG